MTVHYLPLYYCSRHSSGGDCSLPAVLTAAVQFFPLVVCARCFLFPLPGEDAVSWLQSECGPCSVEEALSAGNEMVAAGLIYHSTYGHGL